MEEMSRENAKKIESDWYSDLDEAIDELIKYRERGQSVFYDFNGHLLYSCDVTVDSAYLEVTGKTKAEFLKAKEEARERRNDVHEWFDRGFDFIYPERRDEWFKFIETSAEGFYEGSFLDTGLDLMERLENGASMEEVVSIFNNNPELSGSAATAIRRMLLRFAKRGPEFCERTAEELSDEEKQIIEEMKKENARLEELHKNDSAKGVSPKRKTEEQGIIDSVEEKQRIMDEISALEQQIRELQAREAELKKTLENNQSGVNETEGR